MNIIERKDKIVHLCEMKFYESEYLVNENDHANLMNKIDRMKQMSKSKKPLQILPTLITTFGLKKKGYWTDYARTITLEDLFK